LTPVPGDQHGWKTCLQVYNPEGFSIEFAMVRSSPQRFDCVLSIVVWCGVPPHLLIYRFIVETQIDAFSNNTETLFLTSGFRLPAFIVLTLGRARLAR
jgi:hypothetical protein